jgi:hypothetical protein
MRIRNNVKECEAMILEQDDGFYGDKKALSKVALLCGESAR